MAKGKGAAPVRSAFAERLAAIMAEKGLGQRQLARESGVSQSLISDALRGSSRKVEIGTAAKLAGALGVPTARLLGEDEPLPATASGVLPVAGWVGGIHHDHLPLALLSPSPFNPRRTFEAEELERLADSIRDKGVLQNLVVRKLPDDLLAGQRYQVIAGERRYRALQLLADRGDWDADAAAVPVRVVTADDADAQAIALLENLQRVDVPPLEEGEAFARLHELDPMRFSTDRLAALVRKSRSFVQQRIAMATKLIPEARSMLTAGKLGVDRARALAGAAPKEQKRILKSIDAGVSYLRDAESVRRAVQRAWIPVEAAAFDAEASGLEIVEEEVEDDEATEAAWDAANPGDSEIEVDVPPVMKRARFFVDPDAFAKLQKKAALALVEELKGKWAWARFDGNYSSWRYEKSRARKKAGAIVTIDRWSHKVEVHAGLVEKEAAGPENENAAAVRAERERQEAEREAAAAAFRAALAERLASRPDLALRLLALALICGPQSVPLPIAVTEDVEPVAGGRLDAWRRKLGDAASSETMSERRYVHGVLVRKGAERSALGRLCNLGDPQIVALLTDMVCDLIDPDTAWRSGPIVYWLAGALEVEVPEGLIEAESADGDDEHDDEDGDTVEDAA